MTTSPATYPTSPVEINSMMGSEELKKLVARLRRPSTQQRLGEWLPQLEEAASTIEALQEKVAQTDRLLSLATTRLAEYNADLQSATARAEAAECKLAAIHDKAMAACSEWHASTKNAQARQAYALTLHDIATLSTPPSIEAKTS